jgi:hypothetical protein
MQQQAVGSIWDSFLSTNIPVAPLQTNVQDARCSVFEMYCTGWLVGSSLLEQLESARILSGEI